MNLAGGHLLRGGHYFYLGGIRDKVPHRNTNHQRSRDTWQLMNVCHQQRSAKQAYKSRVFDRDRHHNRNRATQCLHYKSSCPGKQGPWQPQRYVGQTQPNARTEELRSSKSACSWDYARLVSEIEGVMSDDIEANIGYFPLPTSHSRCQAMNFP